jgi:catechol 2,3-dioxygenase-like lactoylglutathione lyase family enzyme
MKQRLHQFALVVRNYDDAIRFYTGKLNFTLVEDTQLSDTKRWVRIQPPGSDGCGILLARAANYDQESRIGNQTGGRVFLFLYTDDFDRDYANLREKGVRIIREPVVEEYGKVCAFADLYGNLIDLIEPV